MGETGRILLGRGVVVSGSNRDAGLRMRRKRTGKGKRVDAANHVPVPGRTSGVKREGLAEDADSAAPLQDLPKARPRQSARKRSGATQAS